MNIYQHFRSEEREFIDHVLDWKDYVAKQYAPKLSDFLDPREQHILKTIIGEHGEIKYSFFGGTLGVERKRALLYPDYFKPAEEDFQITLFDIMYPQKFATIEHRQVLGTLMSLGLKRGKFGDILLDGSRVQFFSATEISSFIQSHIDSIGHAGVKLVDKPFEFALPVKESWKEITITVSSLRLDAVISSVFHLSRQKSLALIQQGIVKLNWTTIANPAFTCEEGDIISVRGFGRIKISQIEGQTKKEKWRIIVGQQK
ncbi:RNA-binding protein [Bacillus rubiinfantis]|uniref:YlmH family RNA-binding protein n=1 Tax=Bacillus rubiinfantis TaxID=1499680 RepID=UPI0005AAAC72|nr:RNA-binding protein [Bacillus rubiinfantis]